MWGNKKRPRGVSSGRKTSMIKVWVKGARNVKLFLRLVPCQFRTLRNGCKEGGFPGWPNWRAFGLVDS
mgnify:CR=1 FL=1